MNDDGEPGAGRPAGGDGDEHDDHGGGQGNSQGEEETGGGRLAAARRSLGGRRRRNADGGRDNQVKVRFSDEEFAAIAARAAASRIGVAHFVALRALDAPAAAGGGGSMDLATMQAWASQMHYLRRELGRLGSNVNQIARLLNGTGEVARGAEQTLAATQVALERVEPVVEWMIAASGMTAR